MTVPLRRTGRPRHTRISVQRRDPDCRQLPFLVEQRALAQQLATYRLDIVDQREQLHSIRTVNPSRTDLQPAQPAQQCFALTEPFFLQIGHDHLIAEIRVSNILFTEVTTWDAAE
jgi:hypothetical protein